MGLAAQAQRIGWVAGSDLFLDPAASYQVARDLAGTDRLVGEQMLRHRLRERGFLASADAGRQMVQLRQTLEGRPRQVLHLKTTVCGAAGTSLPDVVVTAGGTALTQPS